ncbi:hypothetical protein ACI8AC_24140 [Geodermatophilus sp. SYSU D00758]
MIVLGIVVAAIVLACLPWWKLKAKLMSPEDRKRYLQERELKRQQREKAAQEAKEKQEQAKRDADERRTVRGPDWALVTTGKLPFMTNGMAGTAATIRNESSVDKSFAVKIHLLAPSGTRFGTLSAMSSRLPGGREELLQFMASPTPGQKLASVEYEVQSY